MHAPRILSIAIFVLLAALAACAPVGTRELHEVIIAGPDEVTRIGYAYGSAEARSRTER